MSLSSDEEHTTEHTPNHHVPQPPQAVFPACICAAVLPIVHLMEDGEVREDGVAGIVLTSKTISNSNKCLSCYLMEDSGVLLKTLTTGHMSSCFMYILQLQICSALY